MEEDADLTALNNTLRTLGKQSGRVDANNCIDTPTLCVDSTNDRVGIGTSAPDVGLHVVGSSVTMQTGGREVLIGTSTTSGVYSIKVNTDGSLLFAVHEIEVTTGAGYGSTNTVIRRFATTKKSNGTAITYADSSTAGGSFTINEAGVYAITYRDANDPGAAFPFGLSVNSNQLTTGVASITAAHMLDYAIAPATSANWPAQLSVIRHFSAGDVVRAHNAATLPTSTTAAATTFRITKLP